MRQGITYWRMKSGDVAAARFADDKADIVNRNVDIATQ